MLNNTYLCAIVRDELVNPAHGIVDFVHSTMPYVQGGVIVDTGSIDGTREVLEKLSSQYENLHVFDRAFKGFSDARNYSLDMAREIFGKNIWALVLDADERIKKDDFELLRREFDIYSKKYNAFHLDFRHVLPDGWWGYRDSHNIRLFKLDKSVKFLKRIAELININKKIHHTPIPIYHFIPDHEGSMLKDSEFYSQLKKVIFRNIYTDDVLDGNTPSPCTFENYAKWKQPNPQRDKYR